MLHQVHSDEAHLGSAAGAGHSTGLRIARVTVVDVVFLGVVCVRTQSAALVLPTPQKAQELGFQRTIFRPTATELTGLDQLVVLMCV